MSARRLASTMPERLDAVATEATLLGRLVLQPPDDVLLAALAELPDGAWPLPVPHGADDPATALRRGAHADDLAELAADHQRLFRGPEHALACPYESVYRSTDHLTFGEETLQVRAAYAEAGVEAPNRGRDPDDHLGLELAFVAHLCIAALEALEGGDPVAAETARRRLDHFLTGHLLRWITDVADAIETHAHTDLYRLVGALLAQEGDRWWRHIQVA